MDSKDTMKILFLCTGNSCRSQMAEGWANHILHGKFTAFSAGIDAKGIDPLAVKVMAEAGIDISSQVSKNIKELPVLVFDVVITLCDNARQTCPVFPGKSKILHRAFDDPPYLSENGGTEEEILNNYRRVRDEIKAFVEELPEILGNHILK